MLVYPNIAKLGIAIQLRNLMQLDDDRFPGFEKRRELVDFLISDFAHIKGIPIEIYAKTPKEPKSSRLGRRPLAEDVILLACAVRSQLHCSSRKTVDHLKKAVALGCLPALPIPHHNSILNYARKNVSIPQRIREAALKISLTCE